MLILADVFDGLVRLFDGPQIVFGILGVVALAGIGGWTLSTVAVNRSRERTRRELAAYVAEGTMDPDKAIALMNAGNTGDAEKASKACMVGIFGCGSGAEETRS